MLSKTFCVLPWYSIEHTQDHTTPCCLLKDTNLNQIRQDLLSGIQSKSCEKCWVLENQGLDSRRIQENRFLDWKLNLDLQNIQQMCQENLHSTILYQLDLSNLCNQACVTCESRFSSKWAEIEKNMPVQTSPPYYQNIDDLNINYAQAQRINLLGGEPMFDPRSFQLLENLLTNGNTKCFISFVTNGSIKLNTKQKKILEKFENLNVCFSIDGISSRFEYMRWPGKWNRLLENLQDYKTFSNNFSVSYTISAVNAIYYDETCNWFEQQNLRYNHNVVYEPTWLSLSNMPVVLKKHLTNHSFFKPFVEIVGNEISAENFIANLHSQDRAKKIDIKDYMPELIAILN